MGDGINLRLRRRDMTVGSTIDQAGKRLVVHVAGEFPVACCPACMRPSATTNGTGWREVIDVVRTLVITLAICVRRFVCEYEDCAQRTFTTLPTSSSVSWSSFPSRTRPASIAACT